MLYIYIAGLHMARGNLGVAAEIAECAFSRYQKVTLSCYFEESRIFARPDTTECLSLFLISTYHNHYVGINVNFSLW